MIKPTLTTRSLLSVVILCCSTVTLAKDISNEQNNAYQARKLYNKNKSSHQDLLTRIQQQEKRVAEEQARLNDLKAKEVNAQTAVDQSKIDLDAKTQKLNEVWELRNRK